MHHSEKAWRAHPGANPEHNPRGRIVTRFKHPVTGEQHVIRGPRNPSRWMPHQGKRETARRRAQKAA